MDLKTARILFDRPLPVFERNVITLGQPGIATLRQAYLALLPLGGGKLFVPHGAYLNSDVGGTGPGGMPDVELPDWTEFDPVTDPSYAVFFGEPPKEYFEMTDETTNDVVEVVKQAMAGLETYVTKVTAEVTAEIERQAAAIEAAQNSSIDPDERNAAIVATVNASSARIMAILKPLDDRNADIA